EISITLKLSNKSSFHIDLIENKIFKAGILSRIVTDKGIEQGEISTIKCFQGQIHETALPIALSVDKNFMSGMITETDHVLYFEPLSYFIKDAPEDYYVFYYGEDFKETKAFKCLALETKNYNNKLNNNKQLGKFKLASLGCREVEIAEASDKLMCAHYGSVNAVQNRITSVINNVQTNYCCNFNNNLQLKISEWFNVSCNGTDPWSNSTDAELIFFSFADWAPSYFGKSDIGELFTYRDLDGGTVGVAWVGVVCSEEGYNLIQDWTNNSDLIRVTVAHEVGHNFNCEHDGAGSSYIMAPSVNNTNNWSSLSSNAVNDFVPFLDCLDACASSNPPLAEFSSDKIIGCKSLTIKFTDLSTNKPTAWKWSFPGGIPAVSNIKNPEVTYNVSGNYNVTLVATNASGSNSVTKTAYIEVKDKPIVNFSFIKYQGDLSFNNTTIGGISNNWNFGDGTSSIELNPVHSYSSSGSYIVSLTVSNDCGLSTKSQIVEIVFIPVAAFNASIKEGCDSFSVKYTDISQNNPNSWLWTFQGGTPSTSNLKNPIIEYKTPGQYGVSLISINSEGNDTMSLNNYINVKIKPDIKLSYLQKNDTVYFYNNSGDTLNNYIWDFGDGITSIETSPNHIYENNGDYIIRLIAWNSCGFDTLSENISLVSKPVASFYADKVSGCSSSSFQFYDQSSNTAMKWIWLFPGGIPDTSTLQNPTVYYNNPGLFDVSLVVVNNAGIDTMVMKDYINILNSAEASFIYTINDNIVSFENTSVSGTSFIWNFGDNLSSNELGPGHLYEKSGNYIVELIAMNSCGIDTFFSEISIALPPQAFISSDMTTGCIPLIVNFSDNSIGDIDNWIWDFPGGTPSFSTEQNPTVFYFNKGMFNVSLTIYYKNGSMVLSKADYIIVNEIPKALFSYKKMDNMYSFINNSTGGLFYKWDFGDGSFSFDLNPIHIYTKVGLYKITLTVTNECGNAIYSEQVDITVGQNEIGFLERINIFPNPNKGEFSINISSKENSILEFNLMDLLGRVVNHSVLKIQSGDNMEAIRLNDPEPGQYYLILKSATQLTIRKLIIAN
ncbi:MAG TPA: PKD domain-containing protein, partial [Saprospiraceae bacterium]|nr:PKD domain-containing protein [Saprospiraceae bacterium]